MNRQSTLVSLHLIAKRVAERVARRQLHCAAREGPHQRERSNKTSSRDLGQFKGCPRLRPPASEIEGSQSECLTTFAEIRRRQLPSRTARTTRELNEKMRRRNAG